MYIGIDVGGTFTDAVLIDKDRVISKTKFPTVHDNLLLSLLEALDRVTDQVDNSLIERVVISTTLITNLIVQNKYEPVALVLEPGPGLNPRDYPFKEDTFIIDGAIDYRGRQIIPLDKRQLDLTISEIKKKGYRKAAIVGKFSGRNNAHEIEVGNIFNRAGIITELGHKVSGRLNFLRRAATTMLTVATRDEHVKFVDTVNKAFRDRQITAPIFILKADGGTLSLEDSKKAPVETVFSGPAASTLGAMALSPEGEDTVVMDIGGTTTDLALILSGKPVLASKGATVKGYYTSITSYAVRSVPVGGDTAVAVKGNDIDLLYERKGPAYCFGGPYPTPTDALLVLGYYSHGNVEAAKEGLVKLAEPLGCDVKTVAQKILDKFSQSITGAIEDMFLSWEQEPAYRVWELLHPTQIRPQNIIGVGGAAPGITQAVARLINCTPVIPEHAEVANAIGAAVAQPTLKATLRIDTGEGLYTVEENGNQGSVSKFSSFREEDAVRLAKEQLLKMADDLHVPVDTGSVEVTHSEVFNVIRGFTTTGRIYHVTVQTPRKILTRLYKQGGQDA
ncbi:hydantoinase/oxoprolinase [Thermincola ferriacetica]|uniref:Hydantoinase/oxoprolinase n=1 Tax=Thermincola ferriacetica TaxID=281456 RepID=A0A0L6W6V6_9FIRM|nr:hydantoinase/oxoprolinase family protein [Thermincola ferriacetica]KNZ70834.1 hydantoinase/oxoprolinase [Thermincola ferriacetica]